MSFEQLGLQDALVRAVIDKGYTAPTPIQAQAIPPILEGRDVLGTAQTGTGKTAAFALPILHRLWRGKGSAPRAVPLRCLVLCPTRELATQIGDNFAAYAKHSGVSGTVVFGGVGYEPQRRALSKGVDILVATPGRLIDHMREGLVHFDDLEVLVLDEADRMLDMGFLPAIKQILSKIPQKRQTLAFTATLPKEVTGLLDRILRDPVRISVAPPSSTAERVVQEVFLVDKAQKVDLLVELLERPEVINALVFTRTKHGADRVVKRLERAGIPAAAIHGNKSQNARERALEGLKRGKVRALIATDIASRGIDVKGLSHVINYDIPNEPETYVHRIGRTARADADGKAWSLVEGGDLPHLKLIEKHLKMRLPRGESILGRIDDQSRREQERARTPRAVPGAHGKPAAPTNFGEGVDVPTEDASAREVRPAPPSMRTPAVLQRADRPHADQRHQVREDARRADRERQAEERRKTVERLEAERRAWAEARKAEYAANPESATGGSPERGRSERPAAAPAGGPGVRYSSGPRAPENPWKPRKTRGPSGPHGERGPQGGSQQGGSQQGGPRRGSGGGGRPRR
jgi:ATP-dependent RNA helicase RhlE